MAIFTKEEIKELFAETDKRISRLAERQEKTDAQIAELKEIQKKTDAQIAKTDAQIAKTGAQIAKTDAQIAKTGAQIAKTDAQIAKTDAQIAKTDASVKRLGERYGGLSNNVGKASEQLFFNMLNDNPVLKQIRFNPPQRNWYNKVGKCEDEYDIVMKNDDLFSIFILEVKFKASLSDVEKLMTTKKENFNILFPEYKDYDQHWGLAATIIDEGLRKMALNHGLTVLEYKSELIEHNPPSDPKESWEKELIGA